MPSLYLFRLKVIEQPQRTLFSSTLSRPEFLARLVQTRPKAEARRGYMWHIGNVQTLRPNELVFAVGRTTKTSREQYDEESGDFIALEEEEAPFTFSYLEAELGILGILPKARLAPNVRQIARRIESILNDQYEVRSAGVRIEINEIWDPEDFIHHIRTAFAVVGFTVEFSKPNPFDVEEDFHLPLERYLKAADGDKGKAVVQGDDLNRNLIETLARSMASTGNDASARVRKKHGQRPILRRLKGNSVELPIDEDHPQRPEGVFKEIKRAYHRLRRRGDK